MTADRAYVAITLAGRKRSSRTALRDAVARAVDAEARVMRTRRGVTVVREHDARADPRAEAEKLRQLVGSAIADDVTAGVGGPKSGAAGAHFALIQSEHAVALGPGIHGHGRTIHFDELGAFCFVLNQPAGDVEEFARRLLGPLLDEPKNEELIDTLESYLRNNGSPNAVSRQMFLHRNTVRHRLRRVVALTGADLEDADTRLAFQLAILGRRALAQLAS
jgi:DNA-binding PucR family transcriptional regulator